MPNYGVGILSVMLVAALAMVGSYWFAYLAHCFLVVLEQTAAGAETIDWPDEPFVDWLWKGAYLLWLTAIWLVPVSLLIRWLELPLLWGCVIFALLFPIGLLSSLGAGSKLAVLSWSVLARLARLGYRLLAFYVLSSLLLIAVAWMIRFAGLLEDRARLGMLPLLALVVGLAVLSYARLIGRLGFLIGRVRLPSDDEEKPEDQETPLAGSPPLDTTEPEPEEPAVLPPFWMKGLLTFLIQSSTWGALAWLTAGGSAVGAIVCGLMALRQQLQ